MGNTWERNSDREKARERESYRSETIRQSEGGEGEEEKEKYKMNTRKKQPEQN